MNVTLEASIAAGLASLERVQDSPAGPFGFGADIWCDRDVDFDREVDPFSLEGLAQALLRSIDCRRGHLPGDPNYGIDVALELNQGATFESLRLAGARVEAEWIRDDRVVSATVTLTPDADGSAFTLSGMVTPADPTIGPFRLVAALTDAGALLEEIAR